MGKSTVREDSTIEGFRNNDREIMERVYTEVFPLVRAHVLGNSGDLEQAKDIFQESFVACWKNIKEDKFMEGSLNGYLFSIARNKWTDHLRSPRFKRTVSMGTVSHGFPGEGPSQEQEGPQDPGREDRLQKALTRLGQGCRELLDMFYYQRRSMEEIAKELGIAPASARNQKYRCMEKLRNMGLENRKFGY